MLVNGNKYRRNKRSAAGTLTVESGDTLTVASGGTLTVASGATMTQTGGTLTSPVLTTPQINDTSLDHQYVFVASELAADRNVTLPLLTGADEFTFNAHAQTLTNKTLTSPVVNTPSGTKLTESPTTTNVIAASESGKTFFLNSTTAFASTLPAVAAGLVFDFYVSLAPSATAHTIVAASGTPIVGHLVTSDINSATDADFDATGVLTISFVTAKTVKGDRVHLECDGTNWYATAYASVFDAITFA